MKIPTCADYHLESTMALGTMEQFESQVRAYLKIYGRLYLIGDNFDFRCCSHKRLEALKEFKAKILNIPGVYSIDGNHDVNSITDDYIDIDLGNGFFLRLKHGDFQFWNSKRAIAFRQKPQGAGWFKRTFWINLLEFGEKTLGPNPEHPEFLNKVCDELVDNLKVTHFLCGHKHPNVTYNMKHRNKTIIVSKRGFVVHEIVV